jgi:hypothetical protein
VLNAPNPTTMGSGDSQIDVENAIIENSTDQIEWPEDAADPARFSCSMDLVVWYHPTIPDFT